jgi:hypothetical protein
MYVCVVCGVKYRQVNTPGQSRQGNKNGKSAKSGKEK